MLVSDTLMQALHENFSSNPPVRSEENKISKDRGKKKIKDLKVLDAKAAQNLSVILGIYVINTKCHKHMLILGSTLKNISYVELRNYIIHSDVSVLSDNLLSSLIQV